MGPGSERSLAPEFRKFMPLFAALDGPILDAPCGYGRHALALQELGCRVVCADIDDRALAHLVKSNEAILPPNKKHLQIIKADLVSKPWPLIGSKFSGAINVHFYNKDLLARIADALSPQGIFYIETISNRGGNYLELPKASEVRVTLANSFEFLYYREIKAGPPEAGVVTLRCLAVKL